MATSASRNVSSGNGRRLTTARSPSTAPSRRRNQSKTPSPGELIKRVAELEETTRNQENTKKQEAKRRQKDVASAKKLIAKEIRSAQQALRKSEQEVGKLTQQAARLDQRSDLEFTKKTRQLQKIDEDMRKLQSKRNTLSEAAQKKVAAVGEARGKLAHMQLTASLLELGVVAISDASDAIKKGGVEVKVQNSLCLLGTPDPADEQLVETGIETRQSLQVGCSDARSANGSIVDSPDVEESSITPPCTVASMSSTKLRTPDGSVVAFVDALGTVTHPVEADEKLGLTADVELLDFAQDQEVDTTSTCSSKNPASFASSMKPGASILGTGSSAQIIGQQGSVVEFSERPVSPILSMQVAPSIVEDTTTTTSKSMSTALKCDGAWRYSEAKAHQRHEFVPSSSCRLQNAAYHRPTYEPTCEPAGKSTLPSTPMRRCDELLLQNGHHSIAVTAPCRLVVRQTSVEARTPARNTAPEMMRYTRSVSVLPHGTRYSNTPVATPTLQSSPTQHAIGGSSLPAPSAILYEPVAAR